MTIYQDDYLKSARKLMSHGEYTQAMEYLQADIERNPCDNEAYLLLADCFVKMKKMSQAKSTLYSLLSKEPNNKSATDRLQKIQNEESSNINNPNRTNKTNSNSSKPTPITNQSSSNKTINYSSPVVNSSNNSKRVEWSMKNIISSIIGVILLPASIFGIVGCFPLYDSFGWTFLIVFILLGIFSICLILSPLLKPRWKAKDFVFMLMGLIFTPIMTGMCIEDFEKNGQVIILAIICALWIFAPFIKVDV